MTHFRHTLLHSIGTTTYPQSTLPIVFSCLVLPCLDSDEFNQQVATEQALSMPVLNFMMTPDDKALCKNEIGFATFVVAPMWRSLAGLFPGTIIVVVVSLSLVSSSLLSLPLYIHAH